MALQAQAIERRFVYAGMPLPDPSSTMSPAEVLQLWSATYPELLNAAVEGPTVEGAVHTYSFVKAVRDKG